MLKIQL